MLGWLLGVWRAYYRDFLLGGLGYEGDDDKTRNIEGLPLVGIQTVSLLLSICLLVSFAASSAPPMKPKA